MLQTAIADKTGFVSAVTARNGEARAGNMETAKELHAATPEQRSGRTTCKGSIAPLHATNPEQCSGHPTCKGTIPPLHTTLSFDLSGAECQNPAFSARSPTSTTWKPAVPASDRLYRLRLGILRKGENGEPSPWGRIGSVSPFSCAGFFAILHR